MKADPIHAASFRDPSGFLFAREGILYRQINSVYKENYDLLMDSGLYSTLTDQQLLIGHEEVDPSCAVTDEAYKAIRPELIDFISYPYEWCFSQLKDAAVVTLQIQETALAHGMSLKDCSAYNVQFHRGKPIFIDTLSFERYREGSPWVAYRQFCQHFLAPLALMSYTDVRLSQLFRIHIDGVPLDLAASLLPWKTRLRFSTLTHIHLHARSQSRHASDTEGGGGRRMSQLSFRGLIDNLRGAVRKLTWRAQDTEWGRYYDQTNYSDEAMTKKKEIVADFIDALDIESVWDLGANTGLFSRIAADRGIRTVAFDIDPVAVERNYLQVVSEKEENILPLLQDLTNPSCGIGWAGRERTSLAERGPADMVMALALIHHLAISNNVPLAKIGNLLSDLCEYLLIEFVPKHDSQVQKLLATREDVVPRYSKDCFEQEFSEWFSIEKSVRIPTTERHLYLMRKR